MTSEPDTASTPRIHHRFSADLLEFGFRGENCSLQGQQLFRVLSDVLSDLKIHSGDLLEMRALAPEQGPAPYSIVAVCFVWTGVLLLRQFVPPKMLITNGESNLPHVHLGRSFKIVAMTDHTAEC